MPAHSESLTALRRRLHRLAERSGEERETAAVLLEYLATAGCDELHTQLGGEGLAAVWSGLEAGPTVLLRADLDALPIDEGLSLPHASLTPGVSHKCGHDGHMAMLAGVAAALSAQEPARGRAVLLFQPAEETGQGARAVLADPRFAPLWPDRVLALHNLPGYPLGSVVLREGVFASASRGLAVQLQGSSAHAAEPGAGRSPALAIAQLIGEWSAAAQFATALHEAAQVTVIHARLGQRAFGTSPGEGCVMATLRAHEPSVMDALAARCESRARELARAHGLVLELEWVEPFPATRNDAEVVAELAVAAEDLGLAIHWRQEPFPWSEDFGHFTAASPGALFGLGAGEQQPALHHPDYDFPDALLDTGAALLTAALRRLLASNTAKAGA